MMLKALGAIALFASQVVADCVGLPPSHPPSTAPGVDFKIIANNLTLPRAITIDTEGNLLLVERGVGVTRIVLDDSEGLGVCVKSMTRIVNDESLNHGLVLLPGGKILLATSVNDTFVYSYDPVTGVAGPGRSIITNLINEDHITRTLLVPKHNPHLLILSRGSNSNVDPNSVYIDMGLGQIRIYEWAQLLENKEPVQFQNGSVLGWGCRNSVGMTEHPITGHIWSLDNSIDEMTRFGADLDNTNPGEELNFHGSPTDIHGKHYGNFFGYPNCVTISDPSDVKNYTAGTPAIGKPMIHDLSPPNSTDDKCVRDTVVPRLTFNAHMAPLDLQFQPDGLAAFAAWHGSYYRTPPEGYQVTRIEWGHDGFPVASPSDYNPHVPQIWNGNTTNCPPACFRPVGIALQGGGKTGKTARMFMTSDATGELFVLTGLNV